MSVSAASPVSLRQLASFVASGAFGSHGVPKRMRVGRLPLPQRVTDLTPEDEPALADVNIYVDRLAELPLDSWLVPWRPKSVSAVAGAVLGTVSEVTFFDW